MQIALSVHPFVIIACIRSRARAHICIHSHLQRSDRRPDTWPKITLTTLQEYTEATELSTLHWTRTCIWLLGTSDTGMSRFDVLLFPVSVFAFSRNYSRNCVIFRSLPPWWPSPAKCWTQLSALRCLENNLNCLQNAR